MSAVGRSLRDSRHLYWVGENIIARDFPPVASALRDPNGLLAIGGELDSARLLDAYRRGIFPWCNAGQPVLWWSPDPRCVLRPGGVKISRSLAKTIRQGVYEVTCNRAFGEVIRACARPRRDGETTWLTAEMIAAYTALHEAGWAVSVECRREGELVGGLYGVVIGAVFFGESMFSRRRDASKVALAKLAQALERHAFQLIDCQIPSPHLRSLGATLMPRERFIDILRRHCRADTKPRRELAADFI